jgi:para-nitrobenzyl esterase
LQNRAIVVTLNYRLGVLGFLVHDELEHTYGANGGMNGIRDQREALRFVKTHIASFGGSPNKVTTPDYHSALYYTAPRSLCSYIAS